MHPFMSENKLRKGVFYTKLLCTAPASPQSPLKATQMERNGCVLGKLTPKSVAAGFYMLIQT